MQTQQELTELLVANLPAIRRFISRIVNNHSDVEDIVQEAALKAFMHLRDFRAQASFRTWLVSIALNEVRSRNRRKTAARLLYCEPRDLERMAGIGSMDSPYSQCEVQELNRALERALTSLRPAERKVVGLRAIEGCDNADVGRRLSISIPAVKSRYHRAVRHLSARLASLKKPARSCMSSSARLPDIPQYACSHNHNSDDYGRQNVQTESSGARMTARRSVDSSAEVLQI